jgi:hypothetical protein
MKYSFMTNHVYARRTHCEAERSLRNYLAICSIWKGLARARSAVQLTTAGVKS